MTAPFRTRQLANCLETQDDGIVPTSIATLRAYLADPAPFETEIERNRAICHAAFDAAMRKNHPHIGDDK